MSKITQLVIFFLESILAVTRFYDVLKIFPFFIKGKQESSAKRKKSMKEKSFRKKSGGSLCERQRLRKEWQAGDVGGDCIMTSLDSEI